MSVQQLSIYLAAPYGRKHDMQKYAEELKEIGIVCTSSWLAEPHSPAIEMHELSHEEHQTYAQNDVLDVMAADAMVFFTDPTKTITRAGRHVEFGIAIARCMVVYVIGEPENIFHHLANVYHFATWEEVKHQLLLDTL
jgi:nucleoside 2-deoxyribosyltransferase